MTTECIVLNGFEYERNVLGKWYLLEYGELIKDVDLIRTLNECLRNKHLMRNGKNR